MAYNSENNIGSFVPTTNIFEIQGLQGSANGPIDKEVLRNILVHLYQDMCNIALVLNTKDTGYYPLQEFINGQLFFPNGNVTNPNYAGRQVYRTVVNTGALPNTATIDVPHNIDVFNSFTFTRIYGACSDQVNLIYLPLPYVSSFSVAANIELSVDSEFVYISTTADYTSYTNSYVVLEYLKE